MVHWDAEARRYRDENGKLIPVSTVRGWVDDFAAALAVMFTVRASAVLNQFIEGQLSIETLQSWYGTTKNDLRDGHRAATAIAFGGVQQMTPDEWDAADGAINFQMGFWEAFAGGIFAGTIPIDGTLRSRSGMYGAAVYSTYENSVRLREMRAGANEERRIRGGGDSCVTCIDQEGLGWRPIGSLKALGDSECRARCRCHFLFRMVTPK